MKDKEVAIKIYNIERPEEVVKMATTLKSYIVKQKLFTNIKGKNFAHVDGWSFAGFISGLHAKVESVENLSSVKEIKWKSISHVYRGDKIVGIGHALCSSLESTKKGFDEYAILSMAQTRSLGKAYRNTIGWIIKVAGFESTPSEEMHKVDQIPQEDQTTPITQNEGKEGAIVDYVCSKCGKDISKAEAQYSERLYRKMLCRADQKVGKKK